MKKFLKSSFFILFYLGCAYFTTYFYYFYCEWVVTFKVIDSWDKVNACCLIAIGLVVSIAPFFFLIIAFLVLIQYIKSLKTERNY